MEHTRDLIEITAGIVVAIIVGEAVDPLAFRAIERIYPCTPDNTTQWLYLKPFVPAAVAFVYAVSVGTCINGWPPFVGELKLGVPLQTFYATSAVAVLLRTLYVLFLELVASVKDLCARPAARKDE